MPTQKTSKEKVITNIISLFSLRGFDYVLPLVTLPYLVRILGIEKFGLIIFAQAFISYFAIVVNYGFGLSAIRNISVARNDATKLSVIFSSVMLIQSVLLLVSFIILSLIIVIFEKFQANWILYYLTFGSLVGQILIASWFFQGMERIKLISNITIGIRLFFTIMVFVVIKKPDDYLYVPLLNGIGHLIAGLVAFCIILGDHKVRFFLPSKQILRQTFLESTQFFYSRLANDANQNYITFLLGLFYGNVYVGYYAMIEKLYRALYAAISPITQAIYPYMARTKDVIFFKKVFKYTLIIFALIILGSIIYNKWIIYIIFGISEKLASNIFIVLFSATIFGVVSALLGYPLLAALGHIGPANSSLVIAALISFSYTNLSVYFGFGITAVAMTLLIYEFIGCMIRIYYVKRLKVWAI